MCGREKTAEINTSCQLSHLGVSVQQHERRIIDAQILVTIWHQTCFIFAKPLFLIFFNHFNVSNNHHSCHFSLCCEETPVSCCLLATHLFFHGASFFLLSKDAALSSSQRKRKNLLRSCGATPSDVKSCQPRYPWC